MKFINRDPERKSEISRESRKHATCPSSIKEAITEINSTQLLWLYATQFPWLNMATFNLFSTGLREEKMQACKITVGEDRARKVSCTTVLTRKLN